MGKKHTFVRLGVSNLVFSRQYLCGNRVDLFQYFFKYLAKLKDDMTRFFNLLLSLGVLTALTSCVPATEQLPVDPVPVTYAGTLAEVYASVLRTISDDPGVPSYNPGGMDGYERAPSGPWTLMQDSGTREVVSAQTTSSASGFLGSNAEPDVHEIDVRLSTVSEEPPHTKVSVQGTPQAKGLAERIYAQLDERFERLE